MSSRSLRNGFKTPSKDVFKTSSWRFQDVFNTFWRHTAKTIIYRKICLRHLRNLWSVYKFYKSEIFGYTETFKAGFLKGFMKWLLLQINILLLKSGIRKDVAVSVNKKSMNKSISENASYKAWLFNLQYLLVAAYRSVFRTHPV